MTIARRAGSVIGGMILLVATIVLCLWLGLVTLLAGGYWDKMRPAEALDAVARTATDLGAVLLTAAVGLMTCGLITLIAAASRTNGWTVIGSVCSGLFAITFLLAFAAGSNQFTYTANAAHATLSTVVDNQTPLTTLPDPAPTPTPTPTKAPLRAEEMRDAVRILLSDSFDAAVGPVVDEQGDPLDAANVVLASGACGETGTAVRAELAFATDDNAESVRRILAVWDEAGYAPDRAMHEDIRYSDELPVERMSLRDKTTIDGLIHITITGRCATP